MDYLLYGNVLLTLGFITVAAVALTYALCPSWGNYDSSVKGRLAHFSAYIAMVAYACLLGFLFGYPLLALAFQSLRLH